MAVDREVFSWQRHYQIAQQTDQKCKGEEDDVVDKRGRDASWKWCWWGKRFRGRCALRIDSSQVLGPREENPISGMCPSAERETHHFGKDDGAADMAAKQAFGAARPGLEDFDNYMPPLNIHLHSLYT
jgi:hypothetical protein